MLFDYIQNLAVVLVDFLQSALGRNDFNKETKLSWIKMLDAVNAVIETGLQTKSMNNNQINNKKKIVFVILGFCLVYSLTRQKKFNILPNKILKV